MVYVCLICFHGISGSLFVKFFSDLGFCSGNLFLIVPIPDRCLRLPFDGVRITSHTGNKIS